MNGSSAYGIDYPLPGGGAAVYNASGLQFFRHAGALGSAALTAGLSRTLLSSDYYAPFGFDESGAGAGCRSFTGQKQDSDSLHSGGQYDFLRREYNPIQGRWWTPDPAGLAAVDPNNPQSWNEYAYVAGTPLEATDPLGLFPCGDKGQWNCIAEATGTAWPTPPGNGGDYSFNFEGWAAGGELLQLQEEQAYFSQGSSGGSTGSGLTANPSGPTDANPVPPRAPGLFSCAASFADKYSIAGGLHALGIGNNGGIGGFLTNALGGNTFSGIVEGLSHGESTAQLAFAGAFQGLGGSTPAETGISGLATDALAGGLWAHVTGLGQTITTLSGEASLASTTITAADFAAGVGVAKLAIDGSIFLGGLLSCFGH